MIPDFEKRNERMEQASLNELVPDFDKEQEWQKLSEKLHPRKKIAAIWSYAAAIVLLLAGGGWLTLFLTGTHDQQMAVHQPAAIKPDVVEHMAVAADTAVNTNTPVAQSDSHSDAISTDSNKNSVAIKKHKPGHNTYTIANNRITKDVICNGTPCPLEICINQTMRCPNTEPSSISSCSTLEPDQAGQLNYKAHDKVGKNCSLTIHEIEIKSIATGEAILLTENSTPSSAQVFSYITGQRKGDVLAGMFNSDCNHKTQKHNLTLDNSYGNIIIQ